MEMLFTICQAFLLVVLMPQEWFLTDGAHKVLKHMIKKTSNPRLTSTCHCFPKAVMTRSSIGR